MFYNDEKNTSIRIQLLLAGYYLLQSSLKEIENDSFCFVKFSRNHGFGGLFLFTNESKY